MKYWIIVASKDHVMAAKEGGFCQACHGKKWPLEKMQTGDGVLFYSSKEEFGSSKSYQKFTAIGETKEGATYQVTISPNFQPYRKDRSEEHTSELQSRFDLVCRLLLEKKKHNAARTTAALQPE